ncbi:hypothetical protein CN213_15925 [Sinorhizobium meliloti]|uniref:hypothetical protein n=1 Tax=Rhizobium meliloti TaxID=382 RepID=UPI000FDA7127|nr:hypothetical protein [Sinorhizobium meliloti]RVH56234.1 hypothetical protein CN213_15925 [Sinorhizobium meliloti]
MTDLRTFRLRILETHSRAVIAAVGCPARPVIIPLAGVDFEPTGPDSYQVTMSEELAKEYGLVA